MLVRIGFQALHHVFWLRVILMSSCEEEEYGCPMKSPKGE